MKMKWITLMAFVADQVCSNFDLVASEQELQKKNEEIVNTQEISKQSTGQVSSVSGTQQNQPSSAGVTSEVRIRINN